MNQGGLKHAATESRLDTKRERRRGATGRAAALRRAPSDSDCSGETASLSADSGDRAVRAPPPPVRASKSRSRRRGSEWEVLEGLKDGQRFEKRPDVFNGYLHKKRKWPLKGWHKRFFVVDGGILVYARSPTDVARGRLHGSVDVGLSVISAKARRRRIDIDADEFIYHLRAKTADVFRTWLNVLKVHRLYRQHLLTFGARESAPKIHAPHDDLPPTDTSSRTSRISNQTSALSSTEEFHQPINTPTSSSRKPYNFETPNINNPVKSPLLNWHFKNGDKKILFNFQKTLNATERLNKVLRSKNKSLCSMNCLVRINIDDADATSPQDTSQISTNTEEQVHITNLEPNSIHFDSLNNSDSFRNTPKTSNYKSKVSKFLDNKIEPTYYFFARKKRNSTTFPYDLSTNDPPMRKSKKSTNLAKYRNIVTEPPLNEPISKCLLLKNYRYTKHETIKRSHKNVECGTVQQEHSEVQATTVVKTEHKSLQDLMSVSEYDKITEKIMLSLFEKHQIIRNKKDKEVVFYVKQVVKELYDAKFSDANVHPVKTLFRSLLEYWLKNTTEEPFKHAVRRVKSVEKPSNSHFTRDKILSSLAISNATKQTQFHGLSDFYNTQGQNTHKIDTSTHRHLTALVRNKTDKKAIRCHSPKRDTESFDKEKRVQELERILKNTVYVCETVNSKPSRERDIIMTKKLINNLEMISKKSVVEYANEQKIDNSNSSSELPKIQETINHLISDTSMPADVAKEFFNAYLDVLLDSSKSMSSSSQSSEQNSKYNEPLGDVATDSVQKRISKSVITANLENKENAFSYTGGDRASKLNPEKDSGELYLQEVLEKFATVFTKVDNKSKENNDKSKGDKKDATQDELDRHINEYPRKNLINENIEDNSVVIDLTKYDLQHISMMSDPLLNGVMSITIKMKEKPSNYGKPKNKKLNLKFCNDTKCKSEQSRSDDDWLNNLDDNSLKKIFDPIDMNLTTAYDFDTHKDDIELKPYVSNSDVTSKAHCKTVDKSDHSIDLSFNSSNFFRSDVPDEYEDTQPCYIVSSFKKSALTKLQSKGKLRMKHSNGLLINAGPRWKSPKHSGSSRYPDAYSVFEQAAPKIIDEKFILLLLENLTLLSKSIPSIYKDLNALYLKLKKRHEKLVRNNSNIQGLSLLGKIYNEDSTLNNRETQYEMFGCTVSTGMKVVKIYEDAAVTTNLIFKDKPTSSDRWVSACDINFIKKENEVQTDNVLQKIKHCIAVDTACSSKNFISKERSCLNEPVTSGKKRNEWQNMEHGTSAQRYNTNPVKDCAVSTVIKTLLDSTNSYGNFHMVRPRNMENVNVLKVDRDFLNKQTWFGGITPSYRTSTQSQTDRSFKRNVQVAKRYDYIANEFNVFQLIVGKSELHKSSSTTDSPSLSYKSDDLKTLYRCSSEPSYCSGLVSPMAPPLRGPQACFVSGTPGGRLASWIIESGGPLENASRELGQAQLSVQQLQRLLEALELHQQPHHDTDQVSLEGASPNVKKDRRKFGLRKKKSNSKCTSVELSYQHIDPSTSHMALSALTAPPSPGGGASSMPNSAASLPIACAAARPQSLPGAETLTGPAGPASLTSLTPDHQLREDFTVLAKDLVTSLKNIVTTLVMERGRLRAAVEATESSPGALLAALRTNLNSALHQNNELRSRLSRIHDASDLAEMSSMGPNSDPQGTRQFQQSLSYSSSCVSASEFFDAEEHDEDLKPAEIIAPDEAGVIELDGDSSSEAGSLSSEEGSASSDNSDVLSAEQVTLRLNQNGIEPRPASCWSRRTRLPSARPTPGGPSLWNLLCKNIGKDLSQISMPVTINEPLNMLQRLCEELEYSELLDAAAECKNAVERMALIAAFAVSAYAASAHRAASKPFNPLLGETYECVRGDKGFRFVAEQVSHHPPISACHAESGRWCFWQEARIKTKFWGKSMEFQPAGRVHVRLSTTGDHYSWNKVTTCVHNLFGGQRWVDQYGDMHLVCHGTDIACKLNFIKASSWSSSRHEVRGCVTGEARLRLQGRWSEAIYAGEPPAARCLWRPGAMPPEHELYYGFTRFAMELNEMEPDMQEQLPRTDTRFRPDQRALEQGDVEAAEQFKLELEQAQRERRRLQPNEGPLWFRKSSEGGEETWVCTGEYWKAREAGFPAHALPRIW